VVPLKEEAKFVPLEALPLEVGRGEGVTLRLSGTTISRRHARLERRDDGVYVVDLQSRFGTYVNGTRVGEVRLRPDDQVRFGEAATYEWRPDGLHRLESIGMLVRLEGLLLCVGQRVLLDGASASFPAGSFVGILGPSGAGKTMLLRAVAGIRRPAAGYVRTDETPDVWRDDQSLEAHRRGVGFVPQDDVVYPLLSVRENLWFVARRLLGDTLEPSEMERGVDEVLQLVGLEAHAGKPAGVLSGGQRKRLSVAVELLRRPRLLLLDEPTAGLDPANEAALMEQFKLIARRGTTVVCSTHLMENLRLFDQLLVMGQQHGPRGERRGTVAYCGPPDGLLTQFGCRHFADLYERLESGKFTSAGEGQDQTPWAATAPRSPGDESPSSMARPTEPWRALMRGRMAGRVMRDYTTVLHRSALALGRDGGFRLMVALQPVALAVLVALTQFSPGGTQILCFLSVVVACWLGMNNSIRDLVRDRKAYIRDRLAGLRPGAYLGAKWTIYASLGAAQLLAFWVVLELLVRFVLPEAVLVQFNDLSRVLWWGAMLGSYLCGLGLALTVSAWVRTEDAAVAALPLLILPQILLSPLATGVANLTYEDARPFRPLAITLRHFTHEARQDDAYREGQREPSRISVAALITDVLSLAVYARPALILVQQGGFGQHERSIIVADAVHLLLLLVLTYLSLWLVFLSQEKRWPVLIGY
jgi:ABC-type multidrug transport system ATPase subunit